jgi:hypothetical protein
MRKSIVLFGLLAAAAVATSAYYALGNRYQGVGTCMRSHGGRIDFEESNARTINEARSVFRGRILSIAFDDRLQSNVANFTTLETLKGEKRGQWAIVLHKRYTLETFRQDYGTEVVAVVGAAGNLRGDLFLANQTCGGGLIAGLGDGPFAINASSVLILLANYGIDAAHIGVGARPTNEEIENFRSHYERTVIDARSLHGWLRKLNDYFVALTG